MSFLPNAMSADPSLPPATPGWPGGVRALLMIVGLCAVFVALSRRSSSPPPAVASFSESAIPTDASILASLPAASGGSLYGQALRVAMEAAGKSPQTPRPWIALGDVLAQGQRDTSDPAYFGYAESCYQKALRLDPTAVDAMAGLAWVFGGRHQFDLSILQAGAALARDPTHIASHGIIGDAAVETGDYEKAFDHYQKMMDLRPDLSSLSRGAWLLWLTGDQNRAVLLMEKAIASGGPYTENTDWCRARLAHMHLQNGALAPARGALQPALARQSRNVHVLLAAGQIAAALADFPTAREHFETILQAGPHREALAALGDICIASGDGDGAEKYYVQVEALHRKHLESGLHDHMEMAQFFADRDRQLSEALRLALEPGHLGHPAYADTLAWVYFKNGEQAEAVKWIKTALQAKTPTAAVHYHAGCIAAAAGDRSSAQNHLQQALSKNPAFSLLHAPRAARLLDEIGQATPTPPQPKASVTPPQALTRLR